VPLTCRTSWPASVRSSVTGPALAPRARPCWRGRRSPSIPNRLRCAEPPPNCSVSPARGQRRVQTRDGRRWTRRPPAWRRSRARPGGLADSGGRAAACRSVRRRPPRRSRDWCFLDTSASFGGVRAASTGRNTMIERLLRLTVVAIAVSALLDPPLMVAARERPRLAITLQQAGRCRVAWSPRPSDTRPARGFRGGWFGSRGCRGYRDRSRVSGSCGRISAAHVNRHS
jgi:hypothetical protein